jgi:hypothetical protein
VAGPEGEAAAADAAGQALAHAHEQSDALVEVGGPGPGGLLPDLGRRRLLVAEAGEHLPDGVQADAGRLRGADEGDPPQHRSVVPTLVAAAPAAVDQAELLVEAQGRGVHARPIGDLADGQLDRRHLHSGEGTDFKQTSGAWRGPVALQTA